MPLFKNVLDDAWLGSSLIATSNDSLIVHKKKIYPVNNIFFSLDMWLSVDA
jgi:hypothetical protein